MAATAEVRAWRPPVEGVAEVLHAAFTEHAYPLHTHDTWAVLIIDSGAVAYELEHGEHGALQPLVTLLPPHVPHDGRSATRAGFRKRVLYLEADRIDAALVGRAVDNPTITDPVLRTRIGQLHDALTPDGDVLEAGSRLTLVRDRLDQHLRRDVRPPPDVRDRPLARDLRDLLDARLEEGIGLDEASRLLGAHPTHLVRAFGQEFGLAPHQYLTGLRLDRARRLLLDGRPASGVAQDVGFFDQSHLTRHFKRLLGVTPGAFARGARR